MRKQAQNAENSNKRIYSSFQLFPKNFLEKQNVYAGTFLPKNKKGNSGSSGMQYQSQSFDIDFNVIIEDGAPTKAPNFPSVSNSISVLGNDSIPKSISGISQSYSSLVQNKYFKHNRRGRRRQNDLDILNNSRNNEARLSTDISQIYS